MTTPPQPLPCVHMTNPDDQALQALCSLFNDGGNVVMLPKDARAILSAIREGRIPGVALKTNDGTTCWQCEKCGKTRTGRGCMECLEDRAVEAERVAADNLWWKENYSKIMDDARKERVKGVIG